MKLKWRDFPGVSIAEIGDESTDGFELKVSCCKFHFSTWWLERKGFGDTRLIVKGWLESEDIDARKAEAVDNVKHWLREMTERWEGVEA